MSFIDRKIGLKKRLANSHSRRTFFFLFYSVATPAWALAVVKHQSLPGWSLHNGHGELGDFDRSLHAVFWPLNYRSEELNWGQKTFLNLYEIFKSSLETHLKSSGNFTKNLEKSLTFQRSSRERQKFLKIFRDLQDNFQVS